jgi:SH3-like domain-containing protein
MDRLFALTLVALFLVGAVVTTAFEASAQAAPADSVIMNVDTLVFEEPDSRSRVVLRVQAGERYGVVSDDGTWVEIQLPRGKGFVRRKAVRRDHERPPLAGVGGESPERVSVVDEYADVKAGPGDAYLGLKRVFRGDTFIVAQTSEDQEWIQIQMDGDLGWVRSDQVMEAAAAGPSAIEPSTPVVPAVGQPADNGGGTDATVGGTLDDPPSDGGETVRLQLRLDGTFQQFSQAFSSDAPGDNPLTQYNLTTTAYGPGLGARAWFYDYIGVDVDYGLRLGSPINLALENGEEVSLASTQQRIMVHLLGRYVLGSGKRPTWFGASVGFMLHSVFVQELVVDEVPSPLFTTNTYNGARLGVEGAVAAGPAEIFFGGWFILGALDQGDYLSGTATATTMFAAEAGVDLELTEGFGWYVKGTIESYAVTFEGTSARHPDINAAQNSDQFLSGTTGVSWRPF